MFPLQFTAICIIVYFISKLLPWAKAFNFVLILRVCRGS